MNVRSAEFIVSNTDPAKSPAPDKPEFAFIGRSNVGKSSLLNMLVQRKNLAKTSARPGKTQTINHFLINNNWYLVDLPGYGYAGVSQKLRAGWGKMLETYFKKRENLSCTFVLLDSRHDLQRIDGDFIQWLGSLELPLAIVLTKTDKLKRSELGKSKQNFETALLKTWEELPPIFITSAETRTGRDEMLDFIEAAIIRHNKFG